MSDALLSPAVGGVMIAASTAAIGWVLHRMKSERAEGQSDRKLPLMAVMGAFIFAAQMINFTIPGTGSSGHLGGGILLAAMIGSGPALLTMTAVLIIQCLFFADGGLLALGANIFNMGVIPCLVVFPLVFKPIVQRGTAPRRLSAAAVSASIVGLQCGAFCVVLQTLASHVTALPFSAFAMLMQPIHLAIGLVEGLVTAAILVFVQKTRPEIIEGALGRTAPAFSVKKTVAAFGIAAILTAGIVSLFASANPDGLEWSMEKTAGTSELTQSSFVHDGAASVQAHTAVMPDYDFADGQGHGTSAAGLLGALLTCLLAAGAAGGIALAKRRASGQDRIHG